MEFAEYCGFQVHTIGLLVTIFKIDPGGQNPTIKRYAGYITQPTFIEDNSSSNKV